MWCNQFTKYGATVAYKNEALAQVNPQLLEWLETINAEASNDSIPNPSKKSNTSGEKISPQFSIASDEDYLSVAEKYRDGTATEEETEQLRKMMDEAAKKAMSNPCRKRSELCACFPKCGDQRTAAEAGEYRKDHGRTGTQSADRKACQHGEKSGGKTALWGKER